MVSYYVTLEPFQNFFVFFAPEEKGVFPVEAEAKIRPDWGLI